jgi:O-antigen/teichoic acid export membrane protein
MRRLAINSSILTAGAYFAQAATVVIYVVAARNLGPERFGPVLAAIGLVIVVVSFADFGINSWALRALARVGADPDPFIRTFSAKIVIACLLGLGWALIGLLLPSGPEKGAIVILGAYVTSLIAASTIEVPFRASQRMGVVAVVITLEKLTALVVSLLLFSFLRADPIFLSASLVCGSLVSAAAGARLLEPAYRRLRRPTIGDIWFLWRNSFSFGMLGLATQIQRADVAIVNLVSGPVAAGIYGAPARLVGLFSVLPGAFSAAMYPRVAAANDRIAAHREAVKGAAVMMGLLGVILVTTYFLAPSSVAWVLGSEYAASVPVLRVYLVAFALVAINQVMAIFLQAEGQEHSVAAVVAIAVPLGLVTVMLGAVANGPFGAALGAIPPQFLIGLSFFLQILRVMRQASNNNSAIIRAPESEG